MADTVIYYDESEDELAGAGGAAILAILGLDEDLLTFALPANTVIATAVSGFTITANSIALAVEAASAINQDLTTDSSPTFNLGNFTTLHTATLLADHIGEHSSSHGIVFDNDITRVGKFYIDHLEEATGSHGIVVSGQLKVDHIEESSAGHGVVIDGVQLKDGGALNITGGTDTFNITNGTASLDVAAGATVNIDASLSVENPSVVNQDLSSDAGPTFDHVHLTNILFAAASELTISSGAVTRTQAVHTIDTESDDSTDDLATINGGADGLLLAIRAINAARTVVVKDGTGNISCGGADLTLDNIDKYLLFVYDGALSKWVVIGGGGGTASISNEAYSAAWDGAETIAPSQNALYDIISTLAGGHDPVTLATSAEELLGLSDQEVSLVVQGANLIFAGPATGADAAPTFRSLVAADIPGGIVGGGGDFLVVQVFS